MSLAAGQALAHYEVLECLGVGGMGEVYRARDTRLGREVALKLIRPGRQEDADLLARFEREARLLAALNHPHIATLYGIEEDDGVRFLVMELVPGPTLAARLRLGPLPVAEACELSRQLADALEVAHEKGIVHRDLKPANLKLTVQGRLKVLDFGLGKLLPDPAAADEHHAATLSCNTGEGVILGTPAYMSPEQARGEPVDSRTDVWAFGCVLYEMLSGRRAFAGQTLTETLAAVFEREPDWGLLPDNTPTPVRDTLQRCLRKNPERRLRDIRDVRVEIEEGSAILGARTPARNMSTPPPLALETHAPSALKTLPTGAYSATRTDHLPPPALPARSRRGLVLTLSLALGLLLVGVVFLIWLKWGRPEPGPAPIAEAKDKKDPPEPDPIEIINKFNDHSWKMLGDFFKVDPLKAEEFTAVDDVAVLPFETPLDWFEGKDEADRLAAALTEELALQEKLRVTSHTKVRGEGPFYNDPLRVARNLRAAHVLTGKITSRGPMLQVQAELVETKTGTRRWGKTLDWERGASWQGLARQIAAEAGGKAGGK